MLEVVAILACTLFTGASVYISLVEHPARMSLSTEAAAMQWAPSYKRATVIAGDNRSHCNGRRHRALVAGSWGYVALRCAVDFLRHPIHPLFSGERCASAFASGGSHYLSSA
jgi:hypothetical protein